MTITIPTRATTGAAADYADVPDLRIFVFALFFIFGGITSLNDVVIPKLKSLFTLSYGQVMLVQFAFFMAYFIVSLPAAAIVRRFGYLRTAAIGLLAMTAGCLLFIPASSHAQFGIFLAALFVLAAGITIVQVVANPLISMLGRPATAHSRLTFAQAFNSVGTTVFPYVGSGLILGSLANVDPTTLIEPQLSAFRSQQSHVIALTYLGLATVLIVVAALVWLRRNRLVESPVEAVTARHAFDLLRQARFGFGALCIFLYVGAEVSIGSLIVNYLSQSSVWGMSQETAGKYYLPVYWGGAMVGRFIGALLLRLFSPGKVLACAAGAVLLMLAISSQTTGTVSGWALLAIGLFNSIMFPTIFSLACEGLGPRAAEGSGIICVSIVGGAIVPLLTGHAADWVGLKTALLVPAVCYLGILSYGIYARRPKADA